MKIEVIVISAIGIVVSNSANAGDNYDQITRYSEVTHQAQGVSISDSKDQEAAKSIAALIRSGSIQYDPNSSAMILKPSLVQMVNQNITSSEKSQPNEHESEVVISSEDLSHLNQGERFHLKTLLDKARGQSVLRSGTETEVGAEK
jgi:hypothetical protein